MERLEIPKPVAPSLSVFSHDTLGLESDLNDGGLVCANHVVLFRRLGRTRWRTESQIDIPGIVTNRLGQIDRSNELAARRSLTQVPTDGDKIFYNEPCLSG